jgi:regulator of sirC expression with transglutaminase-like and TPR domain
MPSEPVPPRPNEPVLQRPPSEAFERLASDLREGDTLQIELAEAALWLAAELEPGIDVPAALTAIDALAARCAEELDRSAAEPCAASLVRVLHESLGFRGNLPEYDDPRNSFLDTVIERRTGLPITLSLLTIAVGERLGLAIEPIGLPGHFIARERGPSGTLIDAYGGQILEDADCQAIVSRALGPGARFDRAALRPATDREILVRMLSNLKQSYLVARDPAAALTCCDRILLLAPDLPDEVRDRGLLFEVLGCPNAARSDLTRYLALVGDAPGSDAIRRRVAALTAPGGPLH